jgi:hypothetical protein
MDQYPTRNRPVELAIILIFLTALFAPLLTWSLQRDVFYSESEKRELQPFPSIHDQQSITGFTHGFDNYFQDHFGLREWLIHRYQREVNKRFDRSGVPLVVEGPEGWLFFSGDQILDDLKGRLRFSEQEVLRFHRILINKKQWLKERGIAYLYMIAPNKQSIYPEFLPGHYRKFRQASRLDQLLTGSPDTISEPLLDVRPYLRQEKSTVRLYDKSDTHWNYHGALVAYQALMERVQSLFPEFRPRDQFDFSPDWQNGTGGDLAVMTGRTQEIVEQRPVLDRENFTADETPIKQELRDLLSLPQLKPSYTENAKGRLRVLILHDSFFNTISPFTSESFQEAFYIWQYYDTTTLEFFNRKNFSALLDMYQPDLVIEETVERFLPYFLITNTWFTENIVSSPKNSMLKSVEK